MAWDQRIISIMTTYIGFGVALLLVPTMWRERKQLTRRLVALWALCWFFGVGSVLNTDSVYLFIAHISHIPNLSWLLINFSLMAIGYCVFIIASMPSQLTPSRLRILAYGTAVYALVEALIFFAGGIAFGTPNLVRRDAASVAELAYTNAAYAYSVVVFMLPLAQFARMLIGSRSLEARIRSGAMTIGLLAAEGYSLLRITSSAAIYYSLVTDPALIRAVLWVLFAAAFLCWPLSMLPTRWFDFFRQVRQLYHMSYLYRRLRDDCGRSLSIPLPDWWSQVRQASFYTNAIAVFILDIKWLVTQERLTINDKRLADIVSNLDNNLPQREFIAQCTAQSRALMSQ